MAGALAAAGAAAAALVASPAVLPTNPAVVTATWSGVANPAPTDWVAAYCAGAPTAGFGAWSYVTACPGYASGACTSGLQLTLSYAGCPQMELRYYHDPAPYALVATSGPLTWAPAANASLRHPRTAYGRVPQTEMHVSWTSDDGVTPGVVQLGTAPGAYTLNVTAAAPTTYAPSDLCAPPSAYSFPGYFFHALATGLAPATRYYARAVQGAAATAEFSFVTGKPLGAPTTFAMFADMGVSGSDGASATASHVGALARSGGVDHVIHVGDLSYARGDSAVWEEWMGLLDGAGITPAVPYHVSVGNHEFDYSGPDSPQDPSGAGARMTAAKYPWWNGGDDGGGECGVPTARRFRAPDTGNGVFWYSFDAGLVHVAMVSSEHDPAPGAPMGDWLRADLAGVDRAATPWVLVGIHRPLYETEDYPGDAAVAAGFRGLLEPALLASRVDVVVAGHYHSFQRSCALANLTCVDPAAGGQHGVVHYTSGAAGASLDATTVTPSHYIEKTILGSFGYSVVAVPNATAMRLTLFLNDGNDVGDDVWLVKGVGVVPA